MASTFPQSARVASLDTLKVVLIAMVIVHHAGMAYGPTGGFWPVSDSEHAPILGPFFSVNASFGMPLFFLISGYFVPAAFDRKGGRQFLHDRFQRLGGPLVWFSAFVFVPMIYAGYARRPAIATAFFPYLVRTLFGTWHLGHLWFLANLLFYVSAYAGWRVVGGPLVRPARPAALRNWSILGFTLTLAIVTFLVRLRFAIDQWVAVLGILPVEPAHFARDTAFFAAGAVAYRRGWLHTTPFGKAMGWLAIALTGAVLCFVLPLWSGGGPTAASLRWSIWETLLCTGFCLGLPILFQRFVRKPSRLVRWALPVTYGAYIVHPGPVLGLQILLARAALHPLAKFAIVSLVGVPLSFLMAAGLREIRPTTLRATPTAAP
jgi:peptidoglycan/LPS O-acetylase OafA/YrhL